MQVVGKDADGSDVYHVGYPSYQNSLIEELYDLLDDFFGGDRNYMENYEKLRKAPNHKRMTASELITVIAFLVRAERFSEGTIAEAINTGVLLKVLERLNNIVDQYEEELLNKLIDCHVPVERPDFLESKGLWIEGSFSERYYALYKDYRSSLERYLLKVLDLDEYDRRIKNAASLFQEVSNPDKDFYQFFSSMGLSFFYLRNDLYVEKLSMEEIAYFISLTKEDIDNLNEETISFIEKTWKNIISVGQDGTMIYMCDNEPDSDYFRFPPNEITIGFRYDELACNDHADRDQWSRHNELQNIFVNSLLTEMEKHYQSISDKKVHVVCNDDSTIYETVEDLLFWN